MLNKQKKTIAVIGCGRWGSLLAWYLDRIGHSVALYGRETSKNMKRFLETRQNDLLTLPESVALSVDLSVVEKAEIVVVSVDSQSLRSVLTQLACLNIERKTVVLCMKGIEISTGKRLSEVAAECLPESCRIAVWLGPGHVQEFYAGVPNCMVIDSGDEETKHMLVDHFSSDLIRLYYGEDLVGNEIGAAAKNVIGIAAGMLDGYELSSLKGALMARGAREVARLIRSMEGNELSAYGLCHLGDYEATVFSRHSHNRCFGEAYVKGEKFEALAEGYYTAKALVGLEKKYGVELPICHSVYQILYEGVAPKDALNELFGRQPKTEFY